MNSRIAAGVALALLLAACARPAPQPTANACPASSVPANALEADALAQTQAKARCEQPHSVCTYSIRRTDDGGVLVDVAFQQMDEGGGGCFMAGDAVASYLYDRAGRFVREAHGGLSAEFPEEQAAQPADAPGPVE